MRLFIGIWPAPAMRDEVARYIEGARQDYPDYKWVKPEQLHITLKFLGEVPPEKVNILVNALSAATKDKRPFTLSLGAPGKFPEQGRARVLWIGLNSEVAQLIALAGEIETACAQAGFSGDRKRFRPHLTIARVRATRGGQSEAPGLKVPWQNVTLVSGFCLIESQLRAEGSVYRTLREFSFPKGFPEIS